MFPVDVFFYGGVAYMAFFLDSQNKLIRYCLETTQTYRDFTWETDLSGDLSGFGRVWTGLIRGFQAGFEGFWTGSKPVFQASKVPRKVPKNCLETSQNLSRSRQVPSQILGLFPRFQPLSISCTA